MLFESTYYAIGAWLLISPLMLAMFYTCLLYTSDAADDPGLV